MYLKTERKKNKQTLVINHKNTTKKKEKPLLYFCLPVLHDISKLAVASKLFLLPFFSPWISATNANPKVWMQTFPNLSNSRLVVTTLWRGRLLWVYGIFNPNLRPVFFLNYYYRKQKPFRARRHLLVNKSYRNINRCWNDKNNSPLLWNQSVMCFHWLTQRSPIMCENKSRLSLSLCRLDNFSEVQTR